MPDLEALPADVFERESSLAGLGLDDRAHLDFAERELAGYIRELDADPDGFPFVNGYYDSGDAHLAYALMRHLRPGRLMELGSGYSTRILGLACDRNAAEDAPAHYLAFDPYPPDWLAGGVRGLSALHVEPVQALALDRFTELGSGDVLFVDTSHTVKLGGDVNRVILDVLPRLAPGVFVHFHDIWLPFEYHPELVATMRMYWAEQYLLQAFLALNSDYEIVFATRAACVRQPGRFGALVPAWRPELFPSSFWIRRR